MLVKQTLLIHGDGMHLQKTSAGLPLLYADIVADGSRLLRADMPSLALEFTLLLPYPGAILAMLI